MSYTGVLHTKVIIIFKKKIDNAFETLYSFFNIKNQLYAFSHITGKAV